MSDGPKRDGRGCAPLVAVGVVVAPIVYVLSIGPACLAMKSGVLTAQEFDVLYAPLNWLCGKSPGVGNALNQYADFWI